MKSIITGKPIRILSKQEIKEVKKENARKKRREKKEEQAEEAEEKKLQAKLDKRSGRDKFNSNDTLQKASAEILKQVMAERKIPINGKSIFKTVLNAKLGKRFSRKTRADKHKILAIGCAVYHELAAQPNPKKALHQLADSVGVNIDRISDPCRIIVESLIDYGANKGEKLANRQYAARDARALRYVVREGMSPYDAMHPTKGESITVWADREAKHRSGKRPATKRAKKGPVARVSIESPPDQLAVVELAQRAYEALERLLDQAVVVVTLKGGGEALALAIAPLKGMAAERAARKPGKVQAAIRKAMKKAPGARHKKRVKPPASDHSVKPLLPHQRISVRPTVDLSLERQPPAPDQVVCLQEQ